MYQLENQLETSKHSSKKKFSKTKKNYFCDTKAFFA